MLKANSYYIPKGKVDINDEKERAVSFNHHYSLGPDTLSENGDDLGYLCRRIMSGEDMTSECFGYRQLFGKSLTKPSITNVTPYVVSKSLAQFVRQMIIKSSKDIINSSPSKLLKIFEREKKPRIPKRITQIGDSLSNRFSGRHSVIIPDEPPPLIPSLDIITQFIYDICYSTQMEYECSVVSLVYLTRFLEVAHHNLQFNEYNWRSVVLSCMLIANKMWDDFHVPNAAYCTIFPGLSLARVNQLEVGILTALDYNTWVSPSVYAEKHFSIQACIAEEEIKLLKHKQVVEDQIQRSQLSPIPQSPSPETKKTCPSICSDGNPSILLKADSQENKCIVINSVESKNICQQTQSTNSQVSHLVNPTIFSQQTNPPERDVSPSVNDDGNKSRNSHLEVCQFIDRERKLLISSKSHPVDLHSYFFWCVPFAFKSFITEDVI